MDWLPSSGMWLSFLRLDSRAGDLDYDLAIDASGAGQPSPVAAGLGPEAAADPAGPGGMGSPGVAARLVHGGFVFGLADYAAMLAVNHPNVVLAGAEVRFLKPVVVGERLLATARLAESAGRRRRVEVEVARGGEVVFAGTFHCAVPDRHVLAPAVASPAAPGEAR